MFEKGDYIIYGGRGVCQVLDITAMDMAGLANEGLYYILEPYHQPGSKIFTPVNSTKTVMRRVLSREEAEMLIDEIPLIEALWVENDKMRETRYKECIRSCECRDLIRMIKALYLRKQERLAQRKKITATDDKYFKMAEDNLYAELSIPLKMPKHEIGKYITSRIGR